MTTEQALGIVAGLSLTALFVIATTTMPAWIPLVLITALVTMFTGFDSSIEDQQIAVQRQREEIKDQMTIASAESVRTSSTISREHARTTYLKNQDSINEPNRQELLKDLETIGVDIRRFENMGHAQITKDLFTHEKKELAKLRSFLK